MSGPRLTLLLADGTVLHTKEEGKVGRGDVQSASPSSTKTAQGQLMKISRCQLHLTARDDAWHVTCAGGNPSLLDRYDCEPILLSKGVEHELQNGDVLWLLAEACSMATSGPSTAEGAEDHKQFGPLVIFLEPAEPSAPPSGSGPVVRMALERPAITMEQGVPASAVTGVSRPTPMAEHSAACAAARSWLEERRLRDGSFLVCNVSCQSDRAAEFRLDPRRRDGTLVLECERPLPTSVLVDRPAGALSIRWCDGVETFGTHVPQIPWAQLPHQSGDLHAEVRSTFYSGAREVSVRRRTDKGGIGPFRIDPLASPHERHGAPPGADLFLCLLGRRAALEQALEMQRGRATELQARLDSRGAHLQIEIERLREEEVHEWCDFLPLLTSKLQRLDSLEKQAVAYDLLLSDEVGEDT